MPFCGPKLSLCGAVLSVWGIIQLTLMGLFFYTHSLALIEDLPLKENFESEEALVNDMNVQYHQSAMNCWIAALLYLVTFCVSIQQFWMNNRSTYSV